MNTEKTLDDYSRVVIETDEKSPVTIAEITPEYINVIKGYRVRITPKYYRKNNKLAQELR